MSNILGSVLGSLLGQGSAGGQPQGGTQAALIQSVLAMLMSGGQGGQAGAGGNPLSSILAGLTGGQGAAAGTPGQAAGVGGSGGGLGALVQIFEQAGLGQHVQSWIGSGQNMQLSSDQVTQAFGPDALGHIARAAGMTPSQAADGLAESLPQIVDGATPGGTIDGAGSVGEQQMAAFMRNLLGNR